MKILILAAGYGTRLQKDIHNDKTGKYTHLSNIAKPLLPVGGLPLVTHWMKLITTCIELGEDTQVFVVTNGFYYNQFEEWAKDFPNVKILNDNTTSNETRLGAVACIHLAVTQFDIQEPLIVIGGDTLFGSDFSLQEIITKYKGYNDNQGNTSLVLYNECNDDETHRHGILEIDEKNKVVTFLEKPNPEDTPSRKACPCFYIYSKDVLNMLETFLHDHTDKPLVLRDAPGHFVKYITDRTVLFAEKTSQRFDIGNLQSYIECNDYFITIYEQIQ